MRRGDGSIRNTFDGGNDLPHGMTMPGSEIKPADVSIRQGRCPRRKALYTYG